MSFLLISDAVFHAGVKAAVVHFSAGTMTVREHTMTVKYRRVPFTG